MEITALGQGGQCLVCALDTGIGPAGQSRLWQKARRSYKVCTMGFIDQEQHASLVGHMADGSQIGTPAVIIRAGQEDSDTIRMQRNGICDHPCRDHWQKTEWIR